ncbi:hypothetical protein FBUS_10296 [Fasciolopsis buskii]|uniref:Ig-like domain-containing protein n=1 Tax=Fasciolopsis buskii TaxID=27845 RepID=A0A8E0RMY1_9TREM|nr:hypothetical protein FBUS_10296 [Fasciolopsis buski]
MLNHFYETHHQKTSPNMTNRARPYLFGSHISVVVGLYEIFSPLRDVDGFPILIYQMEQPERVKLSSLSVQKRVSFLSRILDKPVMITDYEIVAPSAERYTGPLHIACRLNYEKFFPLEDEIEVLTERPQINMELIALVKCTTDPTVLMHSFKSDNPNLFENWRIHNGLAMSSVQFRRTGSTDRLPEAYVTFSVIVGLGMPAGWIEILIYEREDDVIISGGCQEIARDILDFSKAPNHSLLQDQFCKARQSNFYNIKAGCVMLPESMALVIVAYNSKTNKTSREEIKSELDNYVKTSLNWFLSNPSDTSLIRWKKFKDSGIALSLLKLKIGWNASVEKGETISMLIRCIPPFPNSVNISYMDINSTNHTVIARLKCDNHAMYYTREKATAADSGRYGCTALPNCQDCASIKCFQSRDLVVLPDDTMVNLFVRRELLQSLENITFDVSKSFLGTGETIYAYCVHLNPKGLRFPIDQRFDYILTQGFNKVTIKLEYTKHPSLTRSTNQGIVYYTPYQIIGPSAKYTSGSLLIQCVFQMDKKNVDPKDIRSINRIKPMTRSKTLDFIVLAEPVIFTTLVMSNSVRLQNHLRGTLKKMTKSAEFSQSATILPEAVYAISNIASIGTPRGIQSAWTIYQNASSLAYERCPIRSQVNLTIGSIPRLLTRHEDFKIMHSKSLVNTTFQCVIRLEHNGIVITAYNIVNTSLDYHFVEVQLLNSLIEWIHFAIDHPSDWTSRPIDAPVGSMIAYGLSRLTVDGQTLLHMNETIRMLGSFDKGENNQIHCFYQADMSEKREKLDERFKIVIDENPVAFWLTKEHAEFTDSGIYTCEVSVPQCDQCPVKPGFVSRRLEVRPDSSALQLLLTHNKLDENSHWKTHYSLTDMDGHYHMYTDIPIYAHCLYQAPVGSLLTPYAILHFAAADEYSEHFLSTQSITSTYRRNHTVLQSYYLVVSEMVGNTGLAKITCELRYQTTEAMEQSLDVSLMNIQLQTTIIMQIRRFVRPYVFLRLTKMANKSIESLFHHMDSIETDVEQLTLVQNHIQIDESILTFSVPVSLGLPRGIFIPWTFMGGKSLISTRENCLVEEQLNLTQRMIPQNMYTDLLYRSVRAGTLVNITLHCVLRPEHTILALLVYSKEGEINQEIDSVLGEKLYQIFQTTESMKNVDKLISQMINFPNGPMISYRLIKLTVQWLGLRKIGSTVKMLGYVGKVRQKEIHCFVKGKSDEARNPLGTHFQIIPTLRGFAFYLIKTSIDYNDTGYYWCTVFRKCRNCTAIYGFSSRRLIVTPDASTIEIVLSHTLVESNTHLIKDFKQYSTNREPYLFNEQTLYVYCCYPNLEASHNKTSFNFQYQAVYPRENLIIKQPSTYIAEMKRDLLEDSRIIQAFLIQSPAKFVEDLYLNVTCTVKYTKELSANPQNNPGIDSAEEFLVSRSQTILFRFRSPSRLFIKHTISSNKYIQQAFQERAGNQIVSAPEFHSSAPKRRILEGLVRICIPLILGIPKGRASIKLLYGNHVIRDERCGEIVLRELNLTEIPTDIKTMMADLSSENLSIIRYCATCRLTSSNMAIVITVVNSFDHTVHDQIVEWAATMSIIKIVSYWMKNQFDMKEFTVEQSSQSYLDYALIKIDVGWRATIVRGEPMVIFGLLGPTGEGKPVCEFRESNETNVSVKKIDENSMNFILIVNRISASFELIKSVTEGWDAGVYSCRLYDCADCTVRGQFEDRELVVFSKQLKLFIHYTHKLRENEISIPGDVYNQVDDNGIPFVYSAQTIYAHCECRADVGNKVPITFRFHFRKISDTKAPKSLSFTFVRKGSQEFGKYWSYTETYRVTGPKPQKNSGQLETICDLHYNHDVIRNDVNRKIGSAVESQRRVINLTNPLSPYIKPETIWTGHDELTSILQHKSTNEITSRNFLEEINNNPVEEGLLHLSVTVSLGRPAGWSAVWVLVDRSANFRAKQCVLVGEEIPRTILDNMEHMSILNRSYECYIQPEYFAILIYTLHVPDVEYDQKRKDQMFMHSILEVVEKWLANPSESKYRTPRLPERSFGEYILCRIKVGWRASLPLQSTVQMFGIIDANSTDPIVCHYGTQDTDRLLDFRFGFEINRGRGYFYLRKSKAELQDSGFYECRLKACPDCPGRFGFPTRQLVILPENSIVNLRFDPADDGLTNANCGSASPLFLSPGQSQVVICSYPFPRGYRRKATSQLYLKSEPNGTEHILKNAFLNLQTQDLIILVNRKVTITVTEKMAEAKNWRIRCGIRFQVHRVPHDIKPVIPVIKLNKFLDFVSVRQKRVKIFEDTFRTNIADITKILKQANLTRPDKVSYLSQSVNSRTREGVMSLEFFMDSGSPEGWTIAWMIYRHNEKLEKDACTVNELSKNLGTRHAGNKYYCSLIPGHVALLIGALQISSSNWTRQMVEQNLESQLLYNLTDWLRMEKNGPSAIQVSKCFYRDLRLLRLDVGWKATVHLGDAIIMIGRLNNQRTQDVRCFYRAANSNLTVKLNKQFEISAGIVPNVFRLIKHNANYGDSGWYSCILDEPPNDPSLIVGMKSRRLIVLPHQDALSCKLTLDEAGNKQVKKTQIDDKRLSYLWAHQMAYFHCIHDTHLDAHFRPIYDVLHEAENSRTKKNTRLLGNAAPRLIRSYGYGQMYRSVYSIRGISSKLYTGLLKVSCLVSMENLTTEINIDKSSGRVELSCTHHYTILELANGQLKIQSDYPDFENQPVPLGTEFVCSGGYGLPRLTYKWIRIVPPYYEKSTDNLEVSSWLPGQGGGWGGPEEPFTDMPSHALVSEGPLLRVPKDKKYEGMNYFYVCRGSNIVHSKKSIIEKSIHISIMICQSDGMTADYAIFISPRLLSACSIQNSPDSQIQFYGYFFNILVRQVILGLPYGGESIRIQYLHRYKESQNSDGSSVKYIWNSFTFISNRQSLASKIYSKQIKPVTKPNACHSVPDSLDNIVKSLVKMRPKDSGRDFIVWLTFDSSLNTTLSSEGMRDIHKLGQAKTKFVVALTHPINEVFDKFNKRIVQSLNPMEVLNILPNFGGTKDCYTCRPSLNDQTLRIQRLPLFEALCKAAGGTISRAWPKPLFAFSSDPQQWMEGQEVSISCVAGKESATQPVMLSELGICRTTQTALSKVNVSNMDIQELRRVCHKQLAKFYPNHEPNSENITHFGATATISLRNEVRNTTILCYRRYGKPVAKILDPIIGVTHQLSFFGSKITGVNLRPVLWLSSELKAASFECSVQGAGVNLVAELLVQQNTSKKPDSKRYEIVARKNLQISVFHQHVPVNLMWLQVSASFNQNELICLVRPDSKTVRQERFMNSLPVSSSHTRASAPIRNLAVVPQCPSPPEIYVKTHQSKLHLGSRFEASCVAATTADGLPLKLYYLTPKISIILCTKVHVKVDNTGLPVAISAPCEPVASDDKDCTFHQFVDRTYYPTHCEAVQHTEHKTVIRTIHFVITKLRPEDMDGRLFCQTINVYSVWSADEQFRAPRLHSRVHVMRFLMEPKIWSFTFVPDTQEWTCSVMAHPFRTEPVIRLLHATPVYLKAQLESYSIFVNSSRPTIMNAHLLPGRNKLDSTVDSADTYYARVKFYPNTFTGELRYGNATLSCSFGGVTKVLRTRLGEEEPPYETLIQKHLVAKAGRQIEFICFTPSSGSNRASQVSLVRNIRHAWLNYDITLVAMTLRNESLQVWSQYDTLVEVTKQFGSWLYTKKESVRVLTGESDDKIGVDIGLLHSTEFDSGTYYCSNWSPKRIQFGSNPINKTIIGDKKQMSFGYRLLSSSPMFRFNEIKSVLVGHLLHLRCIAWSTNPSERKMELFYMVPRNRPVDSNRTVKFNPIQSAIVISQIDHYQKITEDSELHHIGCLMTDGKKERQIVLPGPKTECKAPEDLRWYPDDQMSHSRSSKIICSTDIGCPQPQFQWKWIAGPVPQITNLNDHTYRIVGSGPVLDLGKLPRSGTYVFRCTVTCFCKDEVKTQSIQASFHVSVEDGDLQKRFDSGSYVDSLDSDVTRVSRPEDTTKFDEGVNLEQKVNKKEEIRDKKGITDAFGWDIEHTDSFHKVAPWRSEKSDRLEDIRNWYTSEPHEEIKSTLDRLFNSLRLDDESEMVPKESPKFLLHKTGYLGHALRPTRDFQSRITRGCNQFMASKGERCPKLFYYDKILNTGVATNQKITRVLMQALDFMRTQKTAGIWNEAERQNIGQLDSFFNELKRYYWIYIKRRRKPNKMSNIYHAKVDDQESSVDRLERSTDQPENARIQSDKDIFADTPVESPEDVCEKRRCLPRENVTPRKSTHRNLPLMESNVKVVPLGFRQSLYGLGGLEDTRWNDARATRERERRKFMLIKEDDKKPSNLKAQNFANMLGAKSDDSDGRPIIDERRILLNLKDWNQRPPRAPTDPSNETNQQEITSKLAERLFYGTGANYRVGAEHRFPDDSLRDTIRLEMDKLRIHGLDDETRLEDPLHIPNNPSHFDWAWVNFFRRVISHSIDHSLDKAPRAEHEEEEQMKDFFRVEPGLVKLPSATTAICPIPTTPKSGAYRLVKLRWLRLSHANSLRDGDLNEVEEIIQLGMDKREVKPLLFRFSSPNREFILEVYPPATGFWMDLEISKAWLVIMLPISVILYIILKRQSRLQHSSGQTQPVRSLRHKKN